MMISRLACLSQINRTKQNKTKKHAETFAQNVPQSSHLKESTNNRNQDYFCRKYCKPDKPTPDNTAGNSLFKIQLLNNN
jgi:hypothetical protein